MTISSAITADLRAERRITHHEADVVVVGAGVFGCAVAHTLASQGRSVILLERWMSEPNRIVGELLQPGGVAALRRLGLAHCLEGIDAIPCYGYDVIYYGEECLIPYPAVDDRGRIAGTEILAKGVFVPGEEGSRGRQMNGHVTNGKATNGHAVNGHATGTDLLINGNGNGNGHANGSIKKRGAQQDANSSKEIATELTKPEGRSFHHGRFISQLRRACSEHPNITIFQSEAMDPIRGEHSDQILGVNARTTNPTTQAKEADFFFGALTVVADGYASKFRQHAGLTRAPLVRSKFFALELIDAPLPHFGYGHVILGDQYPVLLYQIGKHETRALIDVPEGLPAASPARGGVRGYIRDCVVPALPEQLRPCMLAALDGEDGSGNGKLKSMPNSWLPPTRQRANGLVLLGDALNMRHPLTGGGMTVALNDVVILSELLHPARVPDLGDAVAVKRAVDELHWRRKSLTGIINVLAQALYSLFAATDGHVRKIRDGCFEYFRRGVKDEPVAMLGGLVHQPSLLVRHFFAVAFLALWLHAVKMVRGAPWPVGWLLVPVAMVEAVLILWKACVVFLPVVWRELQ